MARQYDPLQTLRIASPCNEAWERMAGDARVRHCASCDLNVYNAAELTRDEIRALVERTEGRLCMRLYRRADGTLLTKDCPAGIRALRRRASRWSAAVTAAMLSVAAVLTGCATSRPRFGRQRSTIAIESTAFSTQAVIAGVVTDESGREPLPGVTVILRDEVLHRERAAVTDADGAFTFRGLDASIYRVNAALSGFCPATTELNLKRDQAVRARVRMQVEPTMGQIVVGATTPILDPMPGSLTLSQEVISKLPM